MTVRTPPFDLLGPLPRGRHAIEASAGTGKTYTLATLVTRYVAEQDVSIAEVLVVTFTRAAAAELRDRIRSRLVEAHTALAGAAPPEDPVLAAIHGSDRELRRQRIGDAITDFDAATITTIHGFAQQTLGTLGSAASHNPDSALVTDIGAIVERVAADVLTISVLDSSIPTELLPELGDVVSATHVALNNPSATVLPEVPPSDTDWTSASEAMVRRHVVDEVMRGLDEVRRHGAISSFDDLLADLDDAVSAASSPAATALRGRFRVALIDEFQDTDPVQWSIFESLFGEATDDVGRALVVVGDPKQAIYDFRGANVHTYLEAAHDPATTLTGLEQNWRSDTRSLAATEALLSGATFGDPRIAFQPVAPAPHHDVGIQSTDGSPRPAMSIRVATGPSIVRQQGNAGLVQVGSAEVAVWKDLAVHVRDILQHCLIPDGDGSDPEMRPVRPDDIAVLISANRQGPVARDALADLDIPAVITRGDSVLDTPAADQWHRVLDAMARPTDLRRVRSAALTCFFGWDGNAVAAAGDAELAPVQSRLHHWSETLTQRGLSAFISELFHESGVAARVLSTRDGDRTMTDLDHLAELISHEVDPYISPPGLLAAFTSLADGVPGADPDTDVLARRVETDGRAVQIMTTFVAKGLEFPVVCCPMLHRSGVAKSAHRTWWDDTARQRMLDIAADLPWGTSEERDARRALAEDGAVGTNLRVLYVALTRARHHTAIWWVPGRDTWSSALAKVLFARHDDGSLDATQLCAGKTDHVLGDEVAERLAPVVAASGDTIEILEIGVPTSDRPWVAPGPTDDAELSVARLERVLDRSGARWSFSAIASRSEHAVPFTSDPFDAMSNDAGADDEGIDESIDETDDRTPDGRAEDSGGVALPLGDIPGGATFGSLVHEVLERVDFTSDELDATLHDTVIACIERNPWPVDIDVLVDGLRRVIDTPLGPMFDGRSLREIETVDRLDELAFDLRLGDGPARGSDRDLGALLIAHLDPADPLRGWADGVASGEFSTIFAGHLTGSIDLVARIHPTGGGDERYVVSDYKTNRIAPPGVVATGAHFAPDRLVPAMTEHHYPLQALLYTVALHRYLRWRRPGYDPHVHLGGVGYLFVRGMVGADTPTISGVPHGLFEWRPTPELVIEVSELLDGRLRTAGATT